MKNNVSSTSYLSFTSSRFEIIAVWRISVSTISDILADFEVKFALLYVRQAVNLRVHWFSEISGNCI